MTRAPEDFRRIVIKIGSSLLVDRESGRLRTAWLEALANDIARLSKGGRDLIVVSSGAIALGRGVLGLPRGVLKLEESQAAAAVGQIALAHAYTEMLHKVGLLPSYNHQQVPFAYNMYMRTDELGWRQSTAFKKAFSIDVDIDFIGVW